MTGAFLLRKGRYPPNMAVVDCQSTLTGVRVKRKHDGTFLILLTEQR